MTTFGFLVLALIWLWLTFVALFSAYFQYKLVGWNKKETVILLVSLSCSYISLMWLIANAPFEIVMR